MTLYAEVHISQHNLNIMNASVIQRVPQTLHKFSLTNNSYTEIQISQTNKLQNVYYKCIKLRDPYQI